MGTEKKLYEAAIEGNIPTLKTLIQEDPLLLHRLPSLTPFPDSPLHVSVLHGHLEFTRALLTNNPKLASESDSIGRLPLHIASAKGHVAIIRELLLAGSDACLARDQDGNIPLHSAIFESEGRVEEAVKELALSCPESTRLRMDGGETVLHLCVRNGNFGVLRVLVEEIRENDAENLLNTIDDEGNTIFHLAASHKHLEIIKYLLTRPSIEVNAVNKSHLTALDLIEICPRDVKTLEILNLLLECNAQRGNNSSSIPHNKASTSITKHIKKNGRSGSRPTSSSRTKRWKQFFTFNNGNHKLEEIRGELLIGLAIIVATITSPVMNSKVNDIKVEGSIVSPWSLVPGLAIMVLVVSSLPLKNHACTWLVVQLVYTTIGILSYNYIGVIISYEGRYVNLNVPFCTMCVWFVLLSGASLLNMIRLAVLIVGGFIGCVKRRKLQATS